MKINTILNHLVVKVLKILFLYVFLKIINLFLFGNDKLDQKVANLLLIYYSIQICYQIFKRKIEDFPTEFLEQPLGFQINFHI